MSHIKSSTNDSVPSTSCSFAVLCGFSTSQETGTTLSGDAELAHMVKQLSLVEVKLPIPL
ncbi:hypothetical protein C5167_006478 [Papaver somniferum]|uniref:Uncharacterized protein n=1 Tax=Papaver somniferum TaxID=3469 RepID=A0A4Y7JGM2_PAPSO|nr:hypothetical protein C5167_006478 [Papaver somniferum]